MVERRSQPMQKKKDHNSKQQSKKIIQEFGHHMGISAYDAWRHINREQGSNVASAQDARTQLHNINWERKWNNENYYIPGGGRDWLSAFPNSPAGKVSWLELCLVVSGLIDPKLFSSPLLFGHLPTYGCKNVKMDRLDARTSCTLIDAKLVSPPLLFGHFLT